MAVGDPKGMAFSCGVCHRTPAVGGNLAVTEDINVMALVKGTERYIFLFHDSKRAQALRVLGRYASNPDLSFSWYDAAVLSQKIRQQCSKDHLDRRFTLPQPTDTDDGSSAG